MRCQQVLTNIGKIRRLMAPHVFLLCRLSGLLCKHRRHFSWILTDFLSSDGCSQPSHSRVLSSPEDHNFSCFLQDPVSATVYFWWNFNWVDKVMHLLHAIRSRLVWIVKLWWLFLFLRSLAVMKADILACFVFKEKTLWTLLEGCGVFFLTKTLILALCYFSSSDIPQPGSSDQVRPGHTTDTWLYCHIVCKHSVFIKFSFWPFKCG